MANTVLIWMAFKENGKAHVIYDDGLYGPAFCGKHNTDGFWGDGVGRCRNCERVLETALTKKGK